MLRSSSERAKLLLVTFAVSLLFSVLLSVNIKASAAGDNTEQKELSITFQWGELNDEAVRAGRGRLIKADSDFGEISQSWAWGTVRHQDSKDVEDVFRKMKFTIKDNTTGQTTTVTGDFPETNKATVKSLGKYNAAHTYTVSVVNEDVPSPYFVTYDASTIDKKLEPQFKVDVDHFTWDPSKYPNTMCIRIDALEIIYAKDEDVAAQCFSYTQPKDAQGKFTSEGNWQFKYEEKNIYSRLRVKNNAIQFPATNPSKPGFEFDGWQFYVARTKAGRPYTSFNRLADQPIENLPVAYSPFNSQTTAYPYLFALIRDNKGVNTFADKTGTQYGLINRTFVVFPKWKKGAIYKVQFVNNDKKYAEVEVQANKSIKEGAATGQAMPTEPSKEGYTFKEWNTSKDGKGEKFAADTIVKDNMTVYAIYTENKPEQQPKPTKTEEPGKEPTITTDTTSTEGSTPTVVKPRVAKTGESAGAIGTFSLLSLLFAALKSKKLD